MTTAPSYGDRDLRAARLQAERPHSSQLLEFYRGVLGLQEKVYREATLAEWGVSEAGAAAEGAGPGARLALPWAMLAEGLRSFAGELGPLAPEPARFAGERLGTGDTGALRRLLLGVAGREAIALPAAALGVQEVHAELFARAFLQPWAEVAHRRAGDGLPPTAPDQTLCSACSWPAQVSVIFDESGVLGQRKLHCALCGHGWSYRRQCCAHCGEENPDRLELHQAEGLAHVQIEACATCDRYLKRVDLRRFGKAVPVVEDLATPELDLWAKEQGLEKVCRNLLAL